jgi:hypothetical protein
MTAIVGTLLLLLSSAMTTHAQGVITQPDLTFGSQLIFYYDAREGFTTFVNIRNDGFRSGGALTIQLEVWGPTFDVGTKVTKTFSLDSFTTRVTDIGALKTTDGLPAQQGIVVASIVDGSGMPIHIRALAGNFTVANLATGSAWGSPALGRSARKLDGTPPADGTVVNGTTVFYQVIQADALALATYYNPQSLAPVQDHGNQVIFVNFKDNAGAGAPLTAATTTWTALIFRGNDGMLMGGPFDVTGVTERDLASILGDGANGASGGGGFARTATPLQTANRFIFFVQSLGTFGTGYLLPTVQ